MLQYSSLISLNAFGASNILTPTLVVLMALGAVGAAAIVPLVKLHWAKILIDCYYSQKNENP